VPEKPLPGARQTLRAQALAFRTIFSTPAFWRVAAPMVIGQGAYIALQGLWLGPWLADVAGLSREGVGSYLFLSALTYIAGSVFFGVAGDRLAQAGIPRITVYKVGLSVSLAMLVLMAMGVRGGVGVVLGVYAFSGIAASLAYALLTPLFAPEMTGRVNTAANMLMFTLSFAMQWGIGAALKLFPVVDGRYAAAGYSAAFASLAALQLAAMLWLLPMRSPQPRL
jgi:predicted MFS family arabinose efflux permease